MPLGTEVSVESRIGTAIGGTAGALLLGLGAMCGPALALSIGNAFARFGTQNTLFALAGYFPGFALSDLGTDFAGVSQQGTDLSQPCNL